MAQSITASERRWVKERSIRLQEMMAALDEDLPLLSGESRWISFWTEMRRIYSRTLIHLTTALATGDRNCLKAGTDGWLEVEALIQGAGHELDRSSTAH
ncbi:MAG: hypothetical protein ACE5ID_07445 [Acidobacteriota bacterium]